jgi:adenylate kinase family enzyme
MVNKTVHRKLKIEEHETNLQREMNKCIIRGETVPAQLVVAIVLRKLKIMYKSSNVFIILVDLL